MQHEIFIRQKLLKHGYVVVQILPLVQFFLNQYKILEPVQNMVNWFDFFFVFASKKRKNILAPSIISLSSLSSSSPLYLPHLLFSPCCPNINYLPLPPVPFFLFNCAYLPKFEPTTFRSQIPQPSLLSHASNSWRERNVYWYDNNNNTILVSMAEELNEPCVSKQTFYEHLDNLRSKQHTKESQITLFVEDAFF